MTIDVTLANVGSLLDATTAQTTLNNNNTAIVAGFENALNTSGDQMQGTLDMDSNRLINLPAPVGATEPVRLTDLTNVDGEIVINAIPIGGTTGQMLAKTTNTDYAVGWESPVGVQAGTNISLTGTNPVTISTVTAPTLSLVNSTGLPVTSITGLASGMEANFLAAQNVAGVTGTSNVVFSSSPSITSPIITTPNIIGFADGSSAPVGDVGEYVFTSLAQASAVSMTTGTPVNIVSQSLTAGDWDVTASIGFIPATSTSVTRWGGCLSTTDSFTSTPPFAFITSMAAVVPGNNPNVFPLATYKLSLSTTTTLYLVGVAVFTVSTMGGFGYLSARRAR